ncbi:MAG: hybrid sensor histidine kinase/response regulator [Anaerolineae bacterium]|nr:hybrid sensor histidine kinase/response regulator [Anaerolineae bacterium]
MMDKSKANILVVDDTRANLRFLAEILTRQGYAVRPALNGSAALASAQARPPDLIMLDIMMPQMNGYEVCKELKSDARTCDIPVIFLSALNEVVDKVKAFEIGGVDYITKPFQVEEVLARVETHLSIRRLQHQLEVQNNALQREIAERKQAQAVLEQYACELEASNAELDAFAHTVAHDLKAPLTALIGFSSLLESRFDKLEHEQVASRLSLITQTGYKMTNIIDELLLLSSVRQIEEVETDLLDMGHIVEEALGRFGFEIEKKKAQVVLPNQWPLAAGYGPWVEEVWVNYVSNAIKYGGQPPLVEIGANTMDNSHVRFWVRDNGPGLTPEQQGLLFTQFTRLHAVRVEGHGLGLSIVQRIVSKLGGEVGVDSDFGNGSQFWFTLPVELDARRVC